MARDNPFAVDPFQSPNPPLFGTENGHSATVPSVPIAPASADQWGGSRAGAWGGEPQMSRTNLLGDEEAPPPTIAVQKEDKSGKRAEKLSKREAELNAKEEQLKKWEQELRSNGNLRPKKNWPRCWPILHHDIAGDVPADNQYVVRYCYWAYLGLVWCLTFNWFGALIAMCAINPGSGRLFGFMLATVYWFAGVPGAWILWYQRIYNASRNDRALTYAWFFFMFTVHTAFCTWAAISPPLPIVNDWAHTGFITAVKAFDKNTFTGVVYIIGGVFWSVEALWDVWCLKSVYRIFRGGGVDKKMKRELALHALSKA
ncbi:hypothetical protein WJX84_008606 [Apatococcus fuscideae]|uniref:Secretory carrier-associated membrane protein n=1 Tax=Apatococcus fuscideae TaxID=2026836 RepID=A0AAW1TCE1_9CHLO